jgi:hypothetical protein
MDMLSHYKINKVRIMQSFKICFALFLFTVFTGHVAAIEYGGFGARPAFPIEGNPRTESVFIHTLEPNDVKEDGVLVVNNTTETKTILVYSVDSTPSTDGGFACKQFSQAKNDVGSWISLEKSEVTVEANKNELIPFKIRVPSNAAAGEHNGCIITQEKLEKSDLKSGVSLSFRTGLRVAITIPGEINRQLQVTDFSVNSKDDGKFSMQLRVRNPGNVSIDAEVKVITRYFFGLKHLVNGGGYSVLREDATDWNFTLDKPFWGGWYRTNYSIKYDENSDAVIGLNSSSKLVELNGKAIWFYSPPTNTALTIEITVLIFIIFGFFLLGLSIMRKRWVKKNWVEYEVQTDETITLLAERFDVVWTLLAKANNLKAPYEIKPGEKIKVPPVK